MTEEGEEKVTDVLTAAVCLDPIIATIVHSN